MLLLPMAVTLMASDLLSSAQVGRQALGTAARDRGEARGPRLELGEVWGGTRQGTCQWDLLATGPSGPLEWPVISPSTPRTGLLRPCSLILTRLGADPWWLGQSVAPVLDASLSPSPPLPPCCRELCGPALAGKMMSTVHVGGGTMEASWRQPCLSAPRTSTPIPVWLSPHAGAGPGAKATPATVPALKSLCDGLALRASPGVLAPSQVYRNSVIAQWRALDLDVLLTPMLGPALDLNAPGKATGEVSCPSTHRDTPACLSSSVSSAQCPAGCGEATGKYKRSLGGGLHPWGGPCPWGAHSPTGWREMGVTWDALGGNELPVLSTTEVRDLELRSLWFGEVQFQVQVGFRKAKKNRNNSPGGEASWAKPAPNPGSWALSLTPVCRGRVPSPRGPGWGRRWPLESLAARGALQRLSATLCSTTAWTSPRGWCLSPR